MVEEYSKSEGPKEIEPLTFKVVEFSPTGLIKLGFSEAIKTLSKGRRLESWDLDKVNLISDKILKLNYTSNSGHDEETGK